ncbi:hypothetical protein F5Y18DRAFT_225402 [Xylariaceae sp. FL1019]|nr:hypothetical protein F5Y18DRAFT_225402 [Xylariaceae sp. FL1019]
MTDSPDGPPLFRPVPLRPFALNFREPTPPDEDSLPHTPQNEPFLNLDHINSKLLATRSRRSDSASISRAQSVMNLTSSTLMGIYSPTTYGKYGSGDDLSTPWGTGAETPAKDLSTDEPNYVIQKERPQPTRRHSGSSLPRSQPLSPAVSAMYLGLSAVLLSGLGMLYGIMVATVKDSRSSTTLRVEHLVRASNCSWEYMVFWGVAGLGLGSLLPWFDGLWDSTLQQESSESEADEQRSQSGDAGNGSLADTDWTLPVRGIGMFIGIAFAIRKLQWDSTLQVSLTLALANALLWFLIDRSFPGMAVSSAVAIAGSAVLTNLQPTMVPVPAMPSSLGALYNSSAYADLPSTMLLGGLASQEAIATSIWTLDVLFCCCVCFGNIGRWLARSRKINVTTH